MFFTFWCDDPAEPGGDRELPIMPMILDWWNEVGDIRLYGEAEVRRLVALRGPDCLSLYDRVRIPTCKADIAALVLLFEHGGFSLDAHVGIGDRAALKDLIASLDDREVTLMDMLWEHQEGEDDVRLHNGAMYSRPKSPVMDTLIEAAFRNLRQHEAREAETDGHVDYDVYFLTGPGVMYNDLFTGFAQEGAVLRLRDAFAHRIRLYPLRGDESDPIRLYRHYQYRQPGRHWSERQRHEPLFAPRHQAG